MKDINQIFKEAKEKMEKGRYFNIGDSRIYWDEDRDERVKVVMKELINLFNHKFGYNPIIFGRENEGTLFLLLDSNKKEYIKELINGQVGEITNKLTGDWWVIRIGIIDLDNLGHFHPIEIEYPTEIHIK